MSNKSLQQFLTAIAIIVDATVVELLDGGRVRIEIHEVLKGDNPPTVLGGARYTCLGIDLARRIKLNRKLNQRYIMLLYKDGLYEENSYYEVRLGDAGLECKCWDGSREYVRRWMSVQEFKRLIGQ